MKTEPEEWSWDHEVKPGDKGAEWNGVRNFQAAKNLKNMKIGDKCFFYHTGKIKSIVGIVIVKKNAFLEKTDKTQKFVSSFRGIFSESLCGLFFMDFKLSA